MTSCYGFYLAFYLALLIKELLIKELLIFDEQCQVKSQVKSTCSHLMSIQWSRAVG
jgi:hypothetical protein